MDAWLALVHPDDVSHVLDIVQRATDERTPYELEHRAVWPDGTVHWLYCRGMVTVDDDGNVTGTIGCTGDITARKQLELDAERRVADAELVATRERLHRERLEYLDGLNDSALSATDHRELMRNVAAAAVPQLGDWCAIYFLPEGKAEPEIEVAHTDPAKSTWAEELLNRFPYDRDAPRGVPAVIRTGQIEFVPVLRAETIERAIADVADRALAEELRSIIDALQATSLITVPLRTKRGVIGAIRFVSAESGRTFDDEDVSLGTHRRWPYRRGAREHMADRSATGDRRDAPSGTAAAAAARHRRRQCRRSVLGGRYGDRGGRRLLRHLQDRRPALGDRDRRRLRHRPERGRRHRDRAAHDPRRRDARRPPSGGARLGQRRASRRQPRPVLHHDLLDARARRRRDVAVHLRRRRAPVADRDRGRRHRRRRSVGPARSSVCSPRLRPRSARFCFTRETR